MPWAKEGFASCVSATRPTTAGTCAAGEPGGTPHAPPPNQQRGGRQGTINPGPGVGPDGLGPSPARHALPGEDMAYSTACAARLAAASTGDEGDGDGQLDAAALPSLPRTPLPHTPVLTSRPVPGCRGSAASAMPAAGLQLAEEEQRGPHEPDAGDGASGAALGADERAGDSKLADEGVCSDVPAASSEQTSTLEAAPQLPRAAPSRQQGDRAASTSAVAVDGGHSGGGPQAQGLSGGGKGAAPAAGQGSGQLRRQPGGRQKAGHKGGRR